MYIIYLSYIGEKYKSECKHIEHFNILLSKSTNNAVKYWLIEDIFPRIGTVEKLNVCLKISHVLNANNSKNLVLFSHKHLDTFYPFLSNLTTSSIRYVLYKQLGTTVWRHILKLTLKEEHYSKARNIYRFNYRHLQTLLVLEISLLFCIYMQT